MEKLSLFFDRIKAMSFWQRLFSWSAIRQLSYEAYEQFTSIAKQQEDVEQLRNTITRLETEKQGLEKKIQEIEKILLNKDNQIDNLHKNSLALSP